jgi:hypothetical protein
MWKSRRLFDEFAHRIQIRIAKETTKLSECELETEAFKSEIVIVRQETEQLRHWKDFVLKQSSEIEKNIKGLGMAVMLMCEHFCNELKRLKWNSMRSMKKLTHLKMKSTLLFGNRWHIWKVVGGNWQRKEHKIWVPEDVSEKIAEKQKENERLANVNDHLRDQIRQINAQKSRMAPEVRHSIEDLTEPLRTPRAMILPEKRFPNQSQQQEGHSR